jgi:hypothetical protein
MDSGIAKDRRVVDAAAVQRGSMGRVGGSFGGALVRRVADHPSRERRPMCAGPFER